MKLTRKQIENKIKKWQKELDNFVDEVEVGKWYKHRYFLLICVTDIDADGYINACGFDADVWFDDTSRSVENCGTATGYVLAEKEEIEAALIREAVKRGFRHGVKTEHGVIIDHFNHNYQDIYNSFWFHNIRVFEKGEWCKIIKEEVKEFTMEELTKKLGYAFKIKK